MLLRCVQNKRIQLRKYKDAEMRIRKPKTQFAVMNPMDWYFISFASKFSFHAILDKLSQALKLRTQGAQALRNYYTEFRSLGAGEVEKAAQNLQQCYPNDLELSFSQEFKHFSFFIERLNSDNKEMPTCTIIYVQLLICTVLFLTTVSNLFLSQR